MRTAQVANDSLAGGFVVRAGIVARLFRLKLLRLDADIVVTPAVPTAAEPRNSPVRRPVVVAARAAPPTGSELAEAMRLVHEAARALDR